MKFLTPPRFPPWQPCPRCAERFAVTLNGVTWCTSATCDPRHLTLRALERHFEQYPTTIVKGENNDEQTETERTCRECGCSENRPCRGGCAWVEADLCSGCIEKSTAFWMGCRAMVTELIDMLKPSKEPVLMTLRRALERKLEGFDIIANEALAGENGVPVTEPHEPAPPAAFGKGVRTSDTLELEP